MNMDEIKIVPLLISYLLELVMGAAYTTQRLNHCILGIQSHPIFSFN